MFALPNKDIIENASLFFLTSLIKDKASVLFLKNAVLRLNILWVPGPQNFERANSKPSGEAEERLHSYLCFCTRINVVLVPRVDWAMIEKFEISTLSKLK